MSKKVNQSQRRQAHRTFTKRYWKDKVNTSWGSDCSDENINRMSLGGAPRRLALVKDKKTGLTVEKHVAVELHHAEGYCRGDVPQEDQVMMELWPWEHAEVDPNRHIGYTFVEWRGFL